MNNFILEDGYNSDYIYSMIFAMFYKPSVGMNKIINSDTRHSDTYFIQEFIKTKFIYPIHRNLSIESSTVNKLRLYLYNCNWLKNSTILEHGNISDFYSFLVSTMMEYKLQFIKIEPNNNILTYPKYDLVHITDEYINDNSSKIMSLSTIFSNWINSEIIQNIYSFKFDIVPFILPIYLDIRDPNTKLNKKYIDIMECINLEENGDKIQRTLVWEIHSFVCQSHIDEHYYAVIIDKDDNFIIISDKMVPSCKKINKDDIKNIKLFMLEVRFVFYKAQ
jgi:hypothetical protein